MAIYVASLASAALLTASTTQSMLLLNPVVVAAKITEIGVSFDGSAVATAVRVQLYRVVTPGTPAGPAVTPVKVTGPSAATGAQSTFLSVLTAEPTTVEILRSWYVSPASGLLVVQFPLGQEPVAAGGGSQIGIRVITPASVTPHCDPYIVFDE